MWKIRGDVARELGDIRDGVFLHGQEQESQAQGHSDPPSVAAPRDRRSVTFVFHRDAPDSEEYARPRDGATA